MKINISLFASLRDYAGAKTIELEIPEDTTVGNLKELLVGKYPKMAPARNSIIAAINRKFASDEELVPLDAEVAIFPPVSGG